MENGVDDKVDVLSELIAAKDQTSYIGRELAAFVTQLQDLASRLDEVIQMVVDERRDEGMVDSGEPSSGYVNQDPDLKRH
jgi:hypothetical protein|tara:strand:+ start:189 stop:428 length:240 start_codon:yes stop_codon:yes gene_type:complete